MDTSKDSGWNAFVGLSRDRLLKRLETLAFNRISVEGYKGMAAYTSFKLRPLVLLTGQNSSGKSSLLEVLQLLGSNDNLDGLSLGDAAAKLGSFSRAISRGSEEKSFLVSFDKFNQMLRKEVSVSCLYEVDEENSQRCRLVKLTVETVDDLLFEIDITNTERLKGFINYPRFWKSFGEAYKECQGAREDTSGAHYEDDDGRPVSLNYLYYQSFFKDKEEDFTIEDFGNFPVFYLEKPLLGQEGDLISRFPIAENGIDVPAFCSLERNVFDNFFIDTYYEDLKPLLSVLDEVLFNPFRYLILDEGDSMEGIENENPYIHLLKSGRCSHRFRLAELTHNPSYLAYKGMATADLKVLFDGIEIESENRYVFSSVVRSDTISQEGVKILKEARKEQATRDAFIQFIRAVAKDAVSNALPPHVFVPAVRNNAQLVMMNFGDAFQYNNFLQQAAAQYLNLSSIKKEFVGVHLITLVRMFGFGTDARVFSDEFGALHINIKKGNAEYGISEEGYGINQLFSLILGICVRALRDADDSILHEIMFTGEIDAFFGELIVCVEEPEANLHPNYQSLLADMFIYLSREFGVQFVLETHSEYLIRRLRYLTALWYSNPNAPDAVPKEFWTAFYFNRPDQASRDVPRVFEINVVDEEGNLNRSFGPGFLDIATQSELDYLDLFKPSGN